MAGFLTSSSVSLDNGSNVVNVTGSVDCSFVVSGTAVYINDMLMEGVSGTAADPSGNSTITLRNVYTGTSIVGGTLVAFNTIEGLRDAIQRARELSAEFQAGLGEITQTDTSLKTLLTVLDPTTTITFNDESTVAVTPYQVLVEKVNTSFRVVGTFLSGCTVTSTNEFIADAAGVLWRFTGNGTHIVAAGTIPSSPTYARLFEYTHAGLPDINPADGSAHNADDVAKNGGGSVQDFIDTTESELATIQDDITHISSEVVINSTNISNISSSLSVITPEIAILDSRVSTNESEIDALTLGQGSSVFGYATRALMNADLTPPDKSIAYVTNDATATNNGTYRKVGATGVGSWVQSSNDLASQAYQLATDNKSKLSYISEVGKNKYNPDNNRLGGYYNGNTWASNPSFNSSEIIQLKPASEYVFSSRVTFLGVFNSDGSLSRNPTNQFGVVLTGTESAIRCSIDATDTKFQVEDGATKTAYEPYKQYSKDSFRGDLSTLRNLHLLDDKIDFIVGKNLFNFEAVVNGAYVGFNGELVQAALYSYSDYIRVKPSTTYTLSNGLEFANGYDLDRNHLGRDSNTLTDSFTTSAQTHYVRVSGTTTRMTETLQIEEGLVSTAFEKFGRRGKGVRVDYSDIDNIPVDTSVEPLVAPLFIGTNMLDPDSPDRVDGKYMNGVGGKFSENASYSTSGFIPVKASTLYSYSSKTTKNPVTIDFVHSFDANKQWLQQHPTGMTNVTTHPNAAFLRVSAARASIGGGEPYEVTMQINEGGFIDYVPYQPAINAHNLDTDPLLNLKPRYTTVTVNSNPNATADYTGRNALQEAIDDVYQHATKGNQYILECTGTFEAWEAEHFTTTGASGDNFVFARDWVNLQGKDGFKIVCIMTEESNPKGWNNAVLWNANAWLMDCDIVSIHCRYAMHIEGAGWGNKYQHKKFTRVNMLANNTVLGYGESWGEHVYWEDSSLESLEGTAVYVHSNTDFKERCVVRMTNCELITHDNNPVLYSQHLSSGWDDIVELDNCIVNGSLEISSRRNSDSSNSPETMKKRPVVATLEPMPTNLRIHTYEIDGGDNVLKFLSNSAGANSSVRITGGTAFNDIIGDDNLTLTHQDRYFRNSVAGYSYVDGTADLNGYALSGLDIQPYANKLHSKSLGKRLGDCSIVNKTLTVVVDGGAPQTVTFDKNYNGTSDSTAANFTNAQVVAEMNAALTGCTVEMYAYGSDFFPAFKGNEVLTNNGASAILLGMGIVKTGVSTCRIATRSDARIDGVAMSTADVGNKLVVITRGRLFNRWSGKIHSAKETENLNHNYGVELGIGADGVFDRNSTVKHLRSLGNGVLEFIK